MEQPQGSKKGLQHWRKEPLLEQRELLGLEPGQPQHSTKGPQPGQREFLGLELGQPQH
jgi:hypothetical protein